jgi:hypothetical protein
MDKPERYGIRIGKPGSYRYLDVYDPGTGTESFHQFTADYRNCHWDMIERNQRNRHRVVKQAHADAEFVTESETRKYHTK